MDRGAPGGDVTSSWLAALVALASSGDFPAYGGARSLCSERVYANTMEIHWRSWASVDPVEQVVAFYEKARGEKPTRDHAGGWQWKDPTAPDHHFTIYRADQAGIPSCREKPTAKERTIILDSVAHRR